MSEILQTRGRGPNCKSGARKCSLIKLLARASTLISESCDLRDDRKQQQRARRVSAAPKTGQHRNLYFSSPHLPPTVTITLIADMAGKRANDDDNASAGSEGSKEASESMPPAKKAKPVCVRPLCTCASIPDCNDMSRPRRTKKRSPGKKEKRRSLLRPPQRKLRPRPQPHQSLVVKLRLMPKERSIYFCLRSEESQ